METKSQADDESGRAQDPRELIGKVALIATFATIWGLNMLSTGAGLLAFSEAGGSLSSMARVLSAFSTTMFTTMFIVFVWRRHGATHRLPGIMPRLDALAGTFLPMALMLLPRAEIGNAGQMASFLLICAGMCASLYVLHFLGTSLSLTPQARRLVVHGPYALVRHPLYVCEAVAGVGFFLQVASWQALLILCTQFMFQIRRMLNEEQVLWIAFPDYAAYAARTPRLFPKLVKGDVGAQIGRRVG